jgi:hypothetical protein
VDAVLKAFPVARYLDNGVPSKGKTLEAIQRLLGGN